MKQTGTYAMAQPIAKCQTGTRGLDDTADGGLPLGRPTLICGNAGCGKTLIAMEFLVRGANGHGGPGVFMAFEETGAELTANVAPLGFDLAEPYASGVAPQSTRANENPRAIRDTNLEDRYELSVINLHQQLERAKDEPVIPAPRWSRLRRSAG